MNIDISWDEVAKYVVATPESTRATAELINRHPDRFLFGSDVVAPADSQAQIKVFDTVRAALEAAHAGGKPEGPDG